MQWLVNQNTKDMGDVKIVTKFLLFPMRIGNECRWWEYATYKLKVCGIYRQGNEAKIHYRWNPIEWVNET